MTRSSRSAPKCSGPGTLGRWGISRPAGSFSPWTTPLWEASKCCEPFPPGKVARIEYVNSPVRGQEIWDGIRRWSDARRNSDRVGTRSRADLTKQPGGSFHPCRRAWATARKHLPLKDFAAGGGWKSEAVLLRHYQQPDEATLLRVVTGGVELRDEA
jgi:hypothetical protein